MEVCFTTTANTISATMEKKHFIWNFLSFIDYFLRPSNQVSASNNNLLFQMSAGVVQGTFNTLTYEFVIKICLESGLKSS